MIKFKGHLIEQHVIIKTDKGMFRVNDSGDVGFYIDGCTTHDWFPWDDEIVTDFDYQFSLADIALIKLEGLQLLAANKRN